MGFAFRRLGHAPGVGLGGVAWGVGGSKNFFSQIQPELVCELLTSMAHATVQFFGSPTPSWDLGEGPKGQISLKDV